MSALGLYSRSYLPLLIVIAGPAGVGKDTIARQLIATNPRQFYFVVTATTRPPRPGEAQGVDYFFVSTAEFARMINENELVEYAFVYNDYKGVPKQQIRDALASGKDVIMGVDVQGAASLRRLIPNAVLVFLSAESEESMIGRLRARSSESLGELNLRVATARQEFKRLSEFDYWVINPDGHPEQAVQEILCIIHAERNRVGREPIAL